MRIMQLTDMYRPVIGGVESYVAALSKELVRLGHTAVVVTIQPGGQPEEEIIDGVRIIRIRSLSQNLSRFYSDTSRPFHPPAPDPGAVAALRQFIKNSRMWCIATVGLTTPFTRYTPHKGPAHVVTLHDYGMACPRKTLMRSATQSNALAPASPGACRVHLSSTGCSRARCHADNAGEPVPPASRRSVSDRELGGCRRFQGKPASRR